VGNGVGAGSEGTACEKQKKDSPAEVHKCEAFC
jgi:hypothetical protein